MMRASTEPNSPSCRYLKFPSGPVLNTMNGTITNVSALVSVAMIEPLTAYHGSLRPPRKKSRTLVCLPAMAVPSHVVSTR